MIAPTRISKSLNNRKSTSNETDECIKNHFWLNPDVPSSPYNPEEPGFEDKKYIGSTIHELLDAEPQVVRLTGRKRKEISRAFNDEGKEIECVEVEVLIPESGLLHQCYYCLAWELAGETERFESCGKHAYWCSSVGNELFTVKFMSYFIPLSSANQKALSHPVFQELGRS